MAEDPYKPTGKGKKARHRLNAIDKEIKEINKQLDNARNALGTIITTVPKQAFSKIEGIDEEKSEKIWEELKTKGFTNRKGKLLKKKFKPDDKDFTLNLTSANKKFEQDIIKILQKYYILGEQKQRSMVENIPKRIEFKFNSLKFYIDFTVMASERDDLIDVKGSIIYGTNRTLCFARCITPKKENKCQRTARCDNLEDKPLISFEVTQHGMIQSSGKLEGEWWIEDESKSDLVELHYRTLDLIWKEALDWANEIIVP